MWPWHRGDGEPESRGCDPQAIQKHCGPTKLAPKFVFSKGGVPCAEGKGLGTQLRSLPTKASHPLTAGQPAGLQGCQHGVPLSMCHSCLSSGTGGLPEATVTNPTKKKEIKICHFLPLV